MILGFVLISGFLGCDVSSTGGGIPEPGAPPIPSGVNQTLTDAQATALCTESGTDAAQAAWLIAQQNPNVKNAIKDYCQSIWSNQSSFISLINSGTAPITNLQANSCNFDFEPPNGGQIYTFNYRYDIDVSYTSGDISSTICQDYVESQDITSSGRPVLSVSDLDVKMEIDEQHGLSDATWAVDPAALTSQWEGIRMCSDGLIHEYSPYHFKNSSVNFNFGFTKGTAIASGSLKSFGGILVPATYFTYVTVDEFGNWTDETGHSIGQSADLTAEDVIDQGIGGSRQKNAGIANSLIVTNNINGNYTTNFIIVNVFDRIIGVILSDGTSWTDQTDNYDGINSFAGVNYSQFINGNPESTTGGQKVYGAAVCAQCLDDNGYSSSTAFAVAMHEIGHSMFGLATDGNGNYEHASAPPDHFMLPEVETSPPEGINYEFPYTNLNSQTINALRFSQPGKASWGF